MTASHTPGGWIAVDHASGHVVVREANLLDRSIATVGAEPDARLIAAAPDLLEVLRDVLEGVLNPIAHESYVDAARAAIAKATGGAS